jgi:hypothetical protein
MHDLQALRSKEASTRGSAGSNSQEADEAAEIELTYSTTAIISRAGTPPGTLIVGIIQVTDKEEDSDKTPVKEGPQETLPEPNKITASTPYDFNRKNLTPYGACCR